MGKQLHISVSDLSRTISAISQRHSIRRVKLTSIAKITQSRPQISTFPADPRRYAMKGITFASAFLVGYALGSPLLAQDAVSRTLSQHSSDVSAPFHRCLLGPGANSIQQCLDSSGLSRPAPERHDKRGVLSTYTTWLPSMTWAGSTFLGQEDCYTGLKDQLAWASLVDVKKVIAGACDTAVPAAMKALGVHSALTNGSWTGLAAPILAGAGKVPVSLTLVVTGAQLLTGGKLGDMANSACQDAVQRLLSDSHCTSTQQQGTMPNGGQTQWVLSPGSVMQTILEFGALTDPLPSDTVTSSTATVSPTQPPTQPVPTTTPSPTPAKATDACNVQYEVVADKYYVQGKDFDVDKLGNWGSNLLTKLRHCGVVSGWQFGYYSAADNTPWQWWSTGSLPIGTKSCIGSAISDLGGSSDGCTGAG